MNKHCMERDAAEFVVFVYNRVIRVLMSKIAWHELMPICLFFTHNRVIRALMSQHCLARIDAELFVFTHHRVIRGFMNKHCMARDAAEFLVFVYNRVIRVLMSNIAWHELMPSCLFLRIINIVIRGFMNKHCLARDAAELLVFAIIESFES